MFSSWPRDGSSQTSGWESWASISEASLRFLSRSKVLLRAVQPFRELLDGLGVVAHDSAMVRDGASRIAHPGSLGAGPRNDSARLLGRLSEGERRVAPGPPASRLAPLLEPSSRRLTSYVPLSPPPRDRDVRADATPGLRDLPPIRMTPQAEAGSPPSKESQADDHLENSDWDVISRRESYSQNDDSSDKTDDDTCKKSPPNDDELLSPRGEIEFEVMSL